MLFEVGERGGAANVREHPLLQLFIYALDGGANLFGLGLAVVIADGLSKVAAHELVGTEAQGVFIVKPELFAAFVGRVYQDQMSSFPFFAFVDSFNAGALVKRVTRLVLAAFFFVL